MADTYEIVTHDNGQQGIKCACCERTSWSKGDVDHKWCHCLEEFHPIDLTSDKAKKERRKAFTRSR